MELLKLVSAYCRSRNLDYNQYLSGLFGGLTPENIPPQFIEKQYRYHLEWIKKLQ
jgi:hypothetical protein